MKHRRELFRTTQIPVAYDANADAPLFRAFLEQVFRDDEDRDDKMKSVLEIMGYTLMSHARHEKFSILIGAGANGKSVLLRVLEGLCGTSNVAGVQPSNFDRTFQRAHLHHKLANIVTELRQGEVLADAELKAIVSGETATVEKKFKTPFTMQPYATCWFGTNHMPTTKDFSEALFRRALVITFNRIFTKAEQDPHLSGKLMAELPGILKICLSAYGHALQAGFTEPASAVAATAEWKLEADPIAQFVEERCTRSPSSKIRSSELHGDYRLWAEQNGLRQTLSIKSFRDRLTRLGFGKRKDRDGNWVLGLSLSWGSM
jgi:putative DNA primase/helicase